MATEVRSFMTGGTPRTYSTSQPTPYGATMSPASSATSGPASAQAQRAILDTTLQKADDHEQNARHKQARAIWEEFAAQNPLDGRVPEVLYRIGASFLKEEPKKLDEAIAAWETLAGKFPDTEPAAHARLRNPILEAEMLAAGHAVAFQGVHFLLVKGAQAVLFSVVPQLGHFAAQVVLPVASHNQ